MMEGAAREIRMARIEDFVPGQHVTFTKTFTDEDVSVSSPSPPM
jgi:hypothetical protein